MQTYDGFTVVSCARKKTSKLNKRLQLSLHRSQSLIKLTKTNRAFSHYISRNSTNNNAKNEKEKTGTNQENRSKNQTGKLEEFDALLDPGSYLRNSFSACSISLGLTCLALFAVLKFSVKESRKFTSSGSKFIPVIMLCHNNMGSLCPITIGKGVEKSTLFWTYKKSS